MQTHTRTHTYIHNKYLCCDIYLASQYIFAAPAAVIVDCVVCVDVALDRLIWPAISTIASYRIHTMLGAAQLDIW